MRPIMLFDNIMPTKVVQVLPGSSIQKAYNAAVPGTRIEVHGSHVENVKFDPNKSTTPTAPIWLVAGGPGAKIVPMDQSKTAVSGWNCHYHAVMGLEIAGNGTGFRGVLFGADEMGHGSNFVLFACHIHGFREDGVKASHVDDVQIVANDVHHCGPLGECLDAGVAVRRVYIGHNKVWHHTGRANILSAKSGSEDVIVEYNEVFDGKADGICLGGQGRGNVTAPFTFQVKRMVVRKNKVYGVAQNPIICKGAIDSVVEDNYSACEPTYYQNVIVGEGVHTWDKSDGTTVRQPFHSKNVRIVDNWLLGKTNVSVRTGSTEIVRAPNVLAPTGEWPYPSGPASYVPPDVRAG